MRILAVDPGSKRVGVAISDPTATIAQALMTIPAEPHGTLPSRLAKIAVAHQAERIVVGLPRRLDGTRGPEAAAAEVLAASIRRASGLPVELVDERFSSVAAERSLIEGGVRREKRRHTVDRVAATLMLQSHLDGRKSRAGTGASAPKDDPAGR
jgi:putative Holliday junction resolvase